MSILVKSEHIGSPSQYNKISITVTLDVSLIIEQDVGTVSIAHDGVDPSKVSSSLGTLTCKNEPVKCLGPRLTLMVNSVAVSIFKSDLARLLIVIV